MRALSLISPASRRRAPPVRAPKAGFPRRVGVRFVRRLRTGRRLFAEWLQDDNMETGKGYEGGVAALVIGLKL